MFIFFLKTDRSKWGIRCQKKSKYCTVFLIKFSGGGNIKMLKYILCTGIFFIYLEVITKTVLVTGGAGFIGSHVCEKLLQRGDEVIIIDNLNNAYDPEIKRQHLFEIQQSDFNNKLTIYIEDICNEKEIKNIFEQHHIDTLCHLAARAGIRPSINDPVEYIETNIKGTAILFELAKNHKINNIVFASSSSVYGERTNEKGFMESDQTDQQSSPYGMTKKAGELLARTYFHLYKMPITCLRFFTVYGPRARRDMAPYIFMNAIYNNKPIIVFGDGTALRDFTYIDDIVDGIIKAIDTPLGFEILNLGQGNPITVSELINILEKIIGKKAEIIFKESILGDVSTTHASIAKTQKLLSYKTQYSTEDGIKKMFGWYLKEQGRK